MRWQAYYVSMASVLRFDGKRTTFRWQAYTKPLFNLHFRRTARRPERDRKKNAESTSYTPVMASIYTPLDPTLEKAQKTVMDQHVIPNDGKHIRTFGRPSRSVLSERPIIQLNFQHVIPNDGKHIRTFGRPFLMKNPFGEMKAVIDQHVIPNDGKHIRTFGRLLLPALCPHTGAQMKCPIKTTR